MVRNGLEKEGAKSEKNVVEPDLLTTNLGPKYDPERFIVSYRLVWPAVVYRIVIYRVSYLSEIIGIVSYPGLIVSYLIVDLQAMHSGAGNLCPPFLVPLSEIFAPVPGTFFCGRIAQKRRLSRAGLQ